MTRDTAGQDFRRLVLMQWTVRLEARASGGEVTTTELVTFSRPAVVSTRLLWGSGVVTGPSCHQACDKNAEASGCPRIRLDLAFDRHLWRFGG